jgi:hypothetical protein
MNGTDATNGTDDIWEELYLIHIHALISLVYVNI